MATDTGSAGGVGQDELALARYALALADGIDAALDGWVLRCVYQRCSEAGVDLNDDVRARAEVVALACRTETMPRIRELLVTDIDSQRTTPLALVREAVRFPTDLLAGLGVVASARGEFEERSFPDDLYGLSPSSLADLDPTLGEAALAWGAAKAHVHLTRRRSEGLSQPPR